MSDELATPLDRREFDRWVHDALNRLYDSTFLETHPLVDVLVSPQNLSSRRSQDLRRVLVASIQSLRPSRNVPQYSHDWRGYHILEQRFISGLSPAEVMQRLGMSRSLFYLEQARILETLVDALWQQRVGMDGVTEQENPAKSVPAEGQRLFLSGESETQPEQTIDAEMLRLLDEAAWETVSLDALLLKVGALVQPLAQASQTTLEIDASTPVTLAHAHRVLLRQVLLSQAAGLLEKIPGGRLHIATLCQPGWRGIQLAGETAKASPTALPVQPEMGRRGLNLETSRRILAAMGGSLEVKEPPDRAVPHEPGEGQIIVNLTWAIADEARLLLVIDDNAGMVDLFRRFLDGTIWQVISASSGEQARKLLIDTFPAVVILDVILPEEDGWEVLISLKASPATHAIPVIVCSAINEPQLMASLGAAAYLPKPVTRQSLLQALQSWDCPAASRAPGSPETRPAGG